MKLCVVCLFCSFHFIFFQMYVKNKFFDLNDHLIHSTSQRTMNDLYSKFLFLWKFIGKFTLFEEKMRMKLSVWMKNLPVNPITQPASEQAAKKLCTISIRLSSEGENDEKIQFNVQLKFPSIFYLRLPSHCAKDGHSFFHLYDYEYKWVWFL